jgi:hypothetical protein
MRWLRNTCGTALNVQLGWTMNNVDYQLFNKRLEEIERSLKVLHAYVDTTLKEKYYGNPVAGGYALSEGSLVGAGLKQEWTKPTNLDDCISTTKLGD